jgi:tRNA A37 threonylcarbamoyladenosine biosynthesis protein TsaE
MARDDQKTSRAQAVAELLKQSIGLLRGEVAPGRKTSLVRSLLRIMRRTWTDQSPFY